MPVDKLEMMMEMQYNLQFKMPPLGRDVMALEGDERAEFLRWNMLACEDEIHEALAETGWKPWATSRHVNGEAYTKELIDAWHFFMNLMLCGAAALNMSIHDYADYFTKKYIEKNIVNQQRQEEGYDGVKDKCIVCHRELDGDQRCPAGHEYKVKELS